VSTGRELLQLLLDESDNDDDMLPSGRGNLTTSAPAVRECLFSFLNAQELDGLEARCLPWGRMVAVRFSPVAVQF
jgi:hypothetical protein